MQRRFSTGAIHDCVEAIQAGRLGDLVKVGEGPRPNHTYLVVFVAIVFPEGVGVSLQKRRVVVVCCIFVQDCKVSDKNSFE